MKNGLIRIPVCGLLRTALCAAAGIVCLASAPALAGGYWSDGIWIPEGVCVGDCGSIVPPGGDPDPSPPDWEKIERINKANAFNEAGLAAWNRGEWGIAAEQFRQAYAWNPNSKVIFKNLINARHKDGLAAMEEGDWEWAADTFQGLLHHQPHSKEFQRLAAAAEEKRQGLRQASDLTRQAIKAADNGDWATALTYFQYAAQLDPRNKMYANNLKIARPNLAYQRNDQGRSAARNGDWAGALNFFQQAAQTDPDEPSYAHNISLAKQRLGEEQQNRAVVVEVQSSINRIAVDLKNAKPAGDLELSDFASTDDAFGTRKSNPALSEAPRQKREGRVTDPGAQLKSVERHSSEAQLQRNDTDKELAREGFETPGEDQGALVYPDKNNHHPPPSALDRQVPAGAKDDPQVQQMQAWYRSLEVRKAEKEQKIAEIKEQQKASKDPLLAAKITTLGNEVKRLNDDQVQATKTVKELVDVIKKQTLDLGLAWDETLPSDTPSAMK